MRDGVLWITAAALALGALLMLIDFVSVAMS